jgi:hypothetical protein
LSFFKSPSSLGKSAITMSVAPAMPLADAVRTWLQQRAWNESEHFGVSQLISTLETPDDAFRLRALDQPNEADGPVAEDIWARISRTLFLAATHPDMFASSSPTQAPLALSDGGASFMPLPLATLFGASHTWSPYLFLSRLLCAGVRGPSSVLVTAPAALSPKSRMRNCKRAFPGGGTLADQICRLLHELGDVTALDAITAKQLEKQMEHVRQRLWIDRIKRETVAWQQQVGYGAIAARLRTTLAPATAPRG